MTLSAKTVCAQVDVVIFVLYNSTQFMETLEEVTKPATTIQSLTEVCMYVHVYNVLIENIEQFHLFHRNSRIKGVQIMWCVTSVF